MQTNNPRLHQNRHHHIHPNTTHPNNKQTKNHKRHNNNTIINRHHVEQRQRLIGVTWEEQKVPTSEIDKEENDGERMVDETDEQNEEKDGDVVEEEAREIDSDARGCFGEGGRKGERGEGEEFGPRVARGEDW